MKSIKLLKSGILIALFILSNQFINQTLAQAYKYVDKDKAFSIEFPGKPDTSKQVVPSDIGNLDMYLVLYEKSIDEVYMLAYTDYPEDIIVASDSKDLLEAAIEGSMSSFGITEPDYEKEITVDGNPGIVYEANIKSDENSMHVINKTIFVKYRLYQILILYQNSEIPEKDSKAFYNSFKLL